MPIWPIMGRRTGKGESGVVKETCRTLVVLMRLWMVSASYVPGGVGWFGGLFLFYFFVGARVMLGREGLIP